MGRKKELEKRRFEEDNAKYQERLEKISGKIKDGFELMDRSDSDDKEYRKVAKAIKEKKGDWLGKWLEKFSVEGDFWNKEKKGKIKNNDYL